jgi:hypothetical protein
LLLIVRPKSTAFLELRRWRQMDQKKKDPGLSPGPVQPEIRAIRVIRAVRVIRVP